MSALDGALEWASRGYKVFPCHDPGPRGKQPRLRGWQGAATTDAERIELWGLEYPDANWGMAIQEYEYVLDADGPEQVQWVVSNLPRTLTVRTGRVDGGAHFVWDLPVGLRLRNRSMVCDVGGLEGKTFGKLVVVPGSEHHTGAVYSVVDDADPELLPQWVIERVGLWVPQVSGHHPTDAELARWGNAYEWSTEVVRGRGEVVYQRCVRALRRDLRASDAWGDVFHRRVQPVGEWVARGAYTYDEACGALERLFRELDDGRGGEKGARHVIRSIARGVASGARSVT